MEADPVKRNISQHPNIVPLDISFYNLLLVYAFLFSLGIFLERCRLDFTKKDQLSFIRVMMKQLWSHATCLIGGRDISLVLKNALCLLNFYQSGHNLNHWKTPNKRKTSPLHLFPVNTLIHITFFEILTLRHRCTHFIPSRTFSEYLVTPHTQRVYMLTGRNSSQRLSIPHMRAIYWPSCLAGHRLMSCLLGTHILHACVPPEHMFPSSVIGFPHFCRKAESIFFPRVLRWHIVPSPSLFVLFFSLRRMC